ncbi:MAG: hypothetical protein U0T36_03225 [Saprospiraceae bacterium]
MPRYATKESILSTFGVLDSTTVINNTQLIAIKIDKRVVILDYIFDK